MSELVRLWLWNSPEELFNHLYQKRESREYHRDILDIIAFICENPELNVIHAELIDTDYIDQSVLKSDFLNFFDITVYRLEYISHINTISDLKRISIRDYSTNKEFIKAIQKTCDDGNTVEYHLNRLLSTDFTEYKSQKDFGMNLNNYLVSRRPDLICVIESDAINPRLFMSCYETIDSKKFWHSQSIMSITIQRDYFTPKFVRDLKTYGNYNAKITLHSIKPVKPRYEKPTDRQRIMEIIEIIPKSIESFDYSHFTEEEITAHYNLHHLFPKNMNPELATKLFIRDGNIPKLYRNCKYVGIEYFKTGNRMIVEIKACIDILADNPEVLMEYLPMVMWTDKYNQFIMPKLNYDHWEWIYQNHPENLIYLDNVDIGLNLLKEYDIVIHLAEEYRLHLERAWSESRKKSANH